jgi:heptaprenylglyceryl phosphate synthase
MLGLRVIFMDAGSGANRPSPSAEMIAAAQKVWYKVRLIHRWRDSAPEMVQEISAAGADVIVIWKCFRA